MQVNQNKVILSEAEKRERRAMERKLSEMEEELKVSRFDTLLLLWICYVCESEWKKMLSYIVNWIMRRLDTIVSDFICTNIHISIFTILDFFLVSYTPSSLFSCVAVTASGKAKTAMIIFGTKTRSLRLYAFPYLAILRKLNALLSFLFSIFDWYSFSLFFTGSNNFQ